MEDYTTKTSNLLKAMGVSFKATKHASERCPLWCDGEHVHGDQYRITFKRESTGELALFNFWNSYNDSREGKAPTAYDVVAGIQKHEIGDITDFASDFGYDPSEPKTKQTHLAVLREYDRVVRFFTPQELELLREIS